MTKETYYVSVKNLTCNRCQTYDVTQFKIELEPHAARVFHKLFRQISEYEWSTAVRAQVPFMPYHEDVVNHAVDNRLHKVYALLHEFGDDDTKHFVEQMPYFS